MVVSVREAIAVPILDSVGGEPVVDGGAEAEVSTEPEVHHKENVHCGVFILAGTDEWIQKC